MRLHCLSAALLLAAPAQAFAQQADETTICTDRPAKANAVCTVPTGKWQLESTVAGWSRLEGGGGRTEGFTLGSSFLKLGLSKQSDLEIGITPFVHVQTKAGGSESNASGFGDLIVRYKRRLTGEGSKVQVAAIPFVKLPTASSSIGNGKVEGGLALPISFALAGPVTATLGPEVDFNADSDGRGRHLALVNLISLSAPIAPKVTFVAELWSNINFDPAGTARQVSADAAVAYLVNRRFQLDAGANVGLTHDTPDVEIYVGASVLF